MQLEKAMEMLAEAEMKSKSSVSAMQARMNAKFNEIDVMMQAVTMRDKIDVGTLDNGLLYVNEGPVVPCFPDNYSGGGFPSLYFTEGQLPDVDPEGNVKRVVHTQLPTGVQVNVSMTKIYMDEVAEGNGP